MRTKKYRPPPLFEVIEDEHDLLLGPPPIAEVEALLGPHSQTVHELHTPVHHYQKEPDSSKRIETALLALWSDRKFWRSVSRYAECQDSSGRRAVHSELADHLRKKHLNLKVVPSPRFWSELHKNKNLKKHFFDSLKQQHELLETKSAPIDLESSKTLVALFKEYVHLPVNADKRGLVAAQSLPPEVLDHLERLARQLSVDARWCADNPSQIPAPAPTAPQGNLLSPDKAKTLENMVLKLLKDPSLTNEQLGATQDGCAATLTRYASEARELALFREGIPRKLLYPAGDARRKYGQKRRSPL